MCPYCREQQVDYHFSGGWPSLEDFAGTRTLLMTYEPTYMSYRTERLELSKCDTCSTLWLYDYWYPDHPPTIINGDALLTVAQKRSAFEKLNAALSSNEQAGMFKDVDTAELHAMLSAQLLSE